MSAKLCPQCGTRYEGDNRFCTLDGATLVLENPADSLTGNVLADRYLIDRKLGEGGMGEVYLAEHIRMKRKVAVKVMRAWLTKDPAAIGRFHREAENASQITHPNVAGVYDFGETPEGLVYLAMEFVEGEPLTAVLEREKVLNHIRASDIVSQTADALAAAHSLGILHRDLKPDNVMIGRTRSRTDLVKLLDFGIARVMGRETQHFTSTGLIVGTPEWMSPEQIAGDKLDARSDIYTLGLIAFRMLTGEGAFSGVTSQEVLLSKMTKAPRRLHDVRGDVEWPEDLQASMDKVLATDQSGRYDDALAFAADFYAGISQLPMTESASDYLNLLSQRTVTPARGTWESTPVRGVPTHETPARGMPRREANVPQLANTTVLPAATAAAIKQEAEAVAASDAEGATTATVETPMPGSREGLNTPSTMGVAIPTPSAPMPATKKSRTPMYAAAGIVALLVIGFAVSKLGGNEAPAPTTASADSTPKGVTAATDSSGALAKGTDSAGRAGAAPLAVANSTTVAPVANRPATPGLDSAANRMRGSIFTVRRGGSRATAFLADGDGIALTSASVVGASPVVDVFLDGSRRVQGKVVAVDSTRGLAAVLVPTKQCPSTCAPIPIAADKVQYKQGDSVMTITGPSLLSSGSRPKGALATATPQRVTASLGGGDPTGSPVFLPDGSVIGVARSGGRTASVVPASVVRAFLREAQSERTSKSIQAADSLLPSWPARPVSSDDIAAGVRRTNADLDAFRIRAGRAQYEALVMTPQILALRKAEADTLRKYFNPGSTTTTFCTGNGPCDPLEAWASLGDYLGERRAVVVIQVAPTAFPPPYRGEHAKQDMNRRPGLVRVVLARGNVEIPPIETSRIYSVVNPSEYQQTQWESLYSGIYVYNPNDLLQGGAMELQVYHGGRDPVKLPISAAVIEGIRRDLAGALR